MFSILIMFKNTFISVILRHIRQFIVPADSPQIWCCRKNTGSVEIRPIDNPRFLVFCQAAHSADFCETRREVPPQTSDVWAAWIISGTRWKDLPGKTTWTFVDTRMKSGARERINFSFLKIRHPFGKYCFKDNFDRSVNLKIKYDKK